MAEPTNEMAINLPIVAVPPVGVVDVPPVQDMDDTMVVGAPRHEHDPSKVSVYAGTITPVANNYGTVSSAETASAPAPADAVAVFDIVFSVGIDCGGGVTKTYQVVKRIGIDKCKIACEAECTTPVSIVESKAEAALAEAAATKKRFRILAGLE